MPHSEILGSKPVRGSPRLIAAYHVLRRLSAPRHPPDTLKTLDCSHRQSALSRVRPSRTDDGGQIKRELSVVRCPSSDLRFRLGVEKTSFASNASGDLSGQAPDPRLVARDRTTEDRRQQDRQSRLPSIRTHATRPSTECASSSQCQISETENGRRRTDSSPSAFRPAKRPGARQSARRRN